MSEAASNLKRFERQVMWRKRLLGLQDRLALAVLIGCVVAGGFVLLARLREGGSVPWVILTIVLVIELGAASFHWVMTRANERDAAFAIDDRLELEDRVITAHTIIEQGGPRRVVETALIEDAAGRIASSRASAIVPYRLKRWHALSLVGIVAFAATIMIPEKALPGGEAVAEARADIQAAGEQLEQAAAEAEQVAPAESETAKLAVEQAELGRSFRLSNESRAEALKKLSSLEGRIRDRHDVLASTRAEEIVNVAERRLRAAISAKPKQPSQAGPNVNSDARDQAEERGSEEARADSEDSKQKTRGKSKSQDITPSGEQARARVNPDSAIVSNSNRGDVSAEQAATRKADQQHLNANKRAGDKSTLAADTRPNAEAQSGQANPQNPLQKPVSSPNAQSGSGDKNSTAGQKEREQNPSEAKGEGAGAEGQKGTDQKESDRKEGDQRDESKDEKKSESGPTAANPLGGLVAEQAVKALPQMSQELMKKAAQLRAGELSPDDIKRLAQAAEFLARDLNQIAQSKELQQALEQMARQINPEQIEQVARQLMSQEQLKRELEAAARLMMQNQQAKEMVAGIKQKVDDIAKQFRGRERDGGTKGPRGPGSDEGQKGKGSAGSDSRMQLGRSADGHKLKGQGKESNVGGNLQRGAGGEYLYLQTRAGAGAARAPYSSAYPQYRREAERSVERSKVPPHMRSVVRSYFDAINPDASKKP
jgi:hypothetical protein